MIFYKATTASTNYFYSLNHGFLSICIDRKIINALTTQILALFDVFMSFQNLFFKV
jgi:hypothetical protein